MKILFVLFCIIVFSGCYTKIAYKGCIKDCKDLVFEYDWHDDDYEQCLERCKYFYKKGIR